MDKTFYDNTHNPQPPTKKGADSNIGEKVMCICFHYLHQCYRNVLTCPTVAWQTSSMVILPNAYSSACLITCIVAGEVIRGRVLDLSDCGNGTGRDIAAEGRAEFERGSNELELGRKPATAPTSTGNIHARTGAAYGSEHAGPYAAADVSTRDPPGTRRDADPGHRTESVPTTVDEGGGARPEHRDEKRLNTPNTIAGPSPRGRCAVRHERGIDDYRDNSKFPREAKRRYCERSGSHLCGWAEGAF